MTRQSGSDVPSVALATTTGGADMKINNCFFTKCRTAIYINSTTAANALTVSNNDFDDNRTGFVLADATYSNITISNNNIVDNRSFGIIFTAATTLSNISIANNNITGNLAAGIGIEGSATSGITLTNNWHGTPTVGIYLGVLNGGFSVDAHNVPSSYPYNFTDLNGVAEPNYPKEIGGVGVTAISGATYASSEISFALPSCGVSSDNPVGWYSTIQAAVTASNSGANIFVTSGIYAENVTVNKSLTIVGEDSALVKLDKGDANYTALGGNGFTITANNVSISKFKIRNYNNGVSNTIDASNISLSQITAIENYGSGFYSNKSINGLSITNSTFKNNGYKNNIHSGGTRRGIMTQSSSSDIANVTITNNVVTDNSLVGIDINLNRSTDGINISDNTLARNGDDELGVWLGNNNKDTSAAVVIKNNNITLSNAVRFGIEIKNPSGSGDSTGVGSIFVSSNTITTSAHIGATRDMGGIVVIRRKDGYSGALCINDQPQGVVIYNNTVNVENIHVNANDAYGIVVGGTGHIVYGNTINNTEVSIQLQTQNDNYLTNNSSNQALTNYYFSRDNSKYSCAIVSSNTINMSGAPRLVTDVSTSTATLSGIQNINTGEYFCAIQSAIDFASTNDVINVASGTYTEDLYLDKKLTIRGANFGISPSGPRMPETTLIPKSSDPDPNSPTAVTMLYITATGSGSTIDGFTFDGNNPDSTSGVLINEGSVDVDACEAISSYDGISNVSISNNIIQNINYCGIDFYNYTNGGTATSGNLIANNLFQGIRPSEYGMAILLYNNCYTSITNNTILGVRVGVQTGNFSQTDPGTSHSITGNNIESVARGIWHNLHYNAASKFDISNNNISTHVTGTANRGIMISTLQQTVGVTLSNNSISGAKYGYYLYSNPTTDTVTITGGFISSTNGIVADNYLGYNANAESSNYKLDGVSILSNDTAIIIRDDAANTNNATVSMVLKNNIYANSMPSNIALAILGSDASALVTNAGGVTALHLLGNIVNNSGNSLDATNADLEINGSTANISGGATVRNLISNTTTSTVIASGIGNTINITNSLTPGDGPLTTNNNLVLKSTATGTASILQGDVAGTYIVGDVTVEKYIPAKASRKWLFVTSPITGTLSNTWQQQIHLTGAGTGGTVCPTLTAHTNGYDPTISSASNIYTYNASATAGMRWQKPATTNADNLTAGKGFRLNVRGNRSLGCDLINGNPAFLAPTATTLSATGNINLSNKNAGDFTINYSNTDPLNYVFIGNPYPSAISFSALYISNMANINNTYAIYIPSNAAGVYSYWDGSTFTGGSGYDNLTGNIIANGQAIFVQAIGSGDLNLNFSESHKTDNTTAGYFRPNSNTQSFKVNYLNDNNNKIDEIVVRFANDATISNNTIGKLDIPSMNHDTYITSLKGATHTSVQTRDINTISNDEVWLNIGATKSGNYKLNFSDYDQLIGTDIYLIDHLANITQDVKQNPEYVFSVDINNAATKGSSRFSVVFSQRVQPVVTQSIKMYPNPARNKVTIMLPTSADNNQHYSINVTDITGKTVKVYKAVKGTQQLNIDKLTTGSYLVEITDSKGSRITEKLIKQ
ncbi:MAG TPA: right-handed parallel beta-helix repeat-containing protein [Chitinophagaceae bacterium]|nr:right-handed parallel beta-helix repeat-containing protein [Chitinophagaceae bacterium]